MELQPVKTRFDIDTDKFVTIQRDPATNITNIDLHDNFTATIIRLASYIDGKFEFYTTNNTTQFIEIMRKQPKLKSEFNHIAIPQGELQPLKDSINSALNRVRGLFTLQLN